MDEVWDGSPAGIGDGTAAVEVAVDASGNGLRLRVTDRRSGHVAYFDPLQLESVVNGTGSFLERLVAAREGAAGGPVGPDPMSP